MNIKSAYEYSQELVILSSLIADTKKTITRVEAAEQFEITDPFSQEGVMMDALNFASMDMKKVLAYLETQHDSIKTMLSDSFF